MKAPKECRYNVGVICADGPERCRRCGWDPEVSATRKREYREDLRPLYRSGMIIKFKEERT